MTRCGARLGEQALHARAVGEIELVESEAVAALQMGEARLLELHVVVGIEIIEADHLDRRGPKAPLPYGSR